MKLHLRKLMRLLKARLRDWLFSDYKWVTRAQVIRIICGYQWNNKDRPYIVRLLENIKNDIG